MELVNVDKPTISKKFLKFQNDKTFVKSRRKYSVVSIITILFLQRSIKYRLPSLKTADALNPRIAQNIKKDGNLDNSQICVSSVKKIKKVKVSSNLFENVCDFNST